MLHADIRGAWEAAVEDPAGRGEGLRELLAAIERHGCPTSPAGASLAIDPAERGAWRAALGTERPGGDLLAEIEVDAFGAARTGALAPVLRLSTLFSRVGFVDPEAVVPVYESFARGWLRAKGEVGTWPERPTSREQRARAVEMLSQRRALPPGLGELFWQVVSTGVDPATITPSIAAFGASYDDRLKDACARAILEFDSQRALASEPWPPRVQIESLSVHPAGTLGHAYYHLIVDNGFDPEVLDPDTVTGFHPGLDGTNRRILQQHEIWHLVAGYSTSPLHETAISGFQLAQFGHNYSAIFLATVTTLLAFTALPFVDLTLQVTAEAWRHGRATRPLLPLDWPSYWHRPIAEVRRELGIETFRSVVPDLMAPPT